MIKNIAITHIDAVENIQSILRGHSLEYRSKTIDTSLKVELKHREQNKISLLLWEKIKPEHHFKQQV